jgi:hypothetical protein
MLILAQWLKANDDRLWVPCYVAAAVLTIWGISLFVRFLDRRIK